MSRKTNGKLAAAVQMSIRSISRLFGVKSAMAVTEFPKTLREFGYDFDADGKLRKLDQSTGLTTREGFEFNVSEDLQYNQKRYEALGEVLNEYVYGLLEKEGLKRLPVPKDGSSDTILKSFVFCSDGALENDKLIIIIHGSGVVRAGQWARRLIINDNLQSGTQIPYIKKSHELGYGVLVLNTNDNQRIVAGKPKKIPGSEDPCRHLDTVWNDYVRPSKVKHIAIVAHSYGGVCVMKFVNFSLFPSIPKNLILHTNSNRIVTVLQAMKNVNEFTKRIFAVALTDSVHSLPAKGTDHIVKVSRNWVASNNPLDTPELSLSGDVDRVSSGHNTHEMSSWACIESLFKFLEDRYRTVSARTDL
ncbi:UPF0528 protein CG10038 isoform X2 [Cephus cinctus]|uniref:UPF0528 protein CG10038 isoform X2 n=1 Tax=Cephus cinctus TaxID=211228 RepID=A0AAJ7BWY7_CEPCN|nr:UPF0528 protein CG10038 isoform X2 [Cephus cinctus]